MPVEGDTGIGRDRNGRKAGGGIEIVMTTLATIGVVASAAQAQVLLDPFEKPFHLPAAAVKFRNGECR